MYTRRPRRPQTDMGIGSCREGEFPSPSSSDEDTIPQLPDDRASIGEALIRLGQQPGAVGSWIWRFQIGYRLKKVHMEFYLKEAGSFLFDRQM